MTSAGTGSSLQEKILEPARMHRSATFIKAHANVSHFAATNAVIRARPSDAQVLTSHSADQQHWWRCVLHLWNTERVLRPGNKL